LRSALLLAAALAVIAPWSVRNTALHGGFVGIDTSHAFNLWRGNAPGAYAERPLPPQASYAPPFESVPLMPVAAQDPRAFVETVSRDLGRSQPSDLEIVRRGRALAWSAIAEDPRTFVRRAGYKLWDLWNPTSFLIRHFRIEAYGSVPLRVERAIIWLAVLAYLGLVGLAASGLLERRDRFAGLVALLVLQVSLLTVLSFGLTRFRLPLVPLLAIIAAQALVRLRSSRAEMVGPAAEV
jgi:hypothetical protein